MNLRSVLAAASLAALAAARADAQSGIALGNELFETRIRSILSSNRVSIHDRHVTILTLLEIVHEKLPYRYAGRDFRLTDVYGNVVRDILA